MSIKSHYQPWRRPKWFLQICMQLASSHHELAKPTTMASMVSLLLLLILPLLLAAVFLISSAHRKCSPLPPSPPKLPIVGHLHLLTDMPHLALTRMAAELGPLLHLQLGRIPTLVVSSPHLARDILRTHDHAFGSRPHTVSVDHLSFGCSDITFSPSGPYWRQARRICVSELLTPHRVRSFRRTRRQEVDRMAAAVAARAGSEVDMTAAFFELANDVFCRVAFGRRCREEDGAAGKLRMADVLAETQALLAGFAVGDFFPGWSWLNTVTGLRRRLERCMGNLRVVCDEVLREHKEKIIACELRKTVDGDKESEEDEGREDFIDVLLRVQKSGKEEVPITDDKIKALVLDLLVAGTDTTAATMDWTMAELVKHPAALRRAQAEVRAVVGPNGVVEEDHLPMLHYLKAAIKESHRMHPPAPLLVPRESISDAVIDGYLIPAKTRVLVNAYAIGRDPEVWPRPMSFEPERFVGGGDGSLEFGLLAFGGGRRGCPGNGFAMVNIELAMARMLYEFDWEVPMGVKREEIDMREMFGLATRKMVPLVLVPKKL